MCLKFGGAWNDRGKESERRQRLKYLDILTAACKDNARQLIRASEDRVLWHRMVANVVDDVTAP